MNKQEREQQEQLIQSLKKAKVEKDRKWVYNLIAWALKNQDVKSYQKFQQRIGSVIHYAKGNYKSYWDNPKNKEQHKKQMERLRGENKVKYESMSSKYNQEQKVAYKLFKEGKLSEKSTSLIESNMGER